MTNLPNVQPAGQSDVTKILVAVHGIGDQTAYATVQSVAKRVSIHRGRLVATPLGRFYHGTMRRAGDQPVKPQPQLMHGDGRELDGLVLAETYWAGIPRQVVEKKYVLEDTKMWGRSVAARVAYKGRTDAEARAKAERLEVVLDQLVDTIHITERLTFLTDKAGLFRFDVAKLLMDFVGDVQIVADFPLYRREILDTLHETVDASRRIAPANNKKEIYLIAHSEGTVITFLALLEALSDPRKHSWIHDVRGLMTIGSPIEVHHLLWPALWIEPQKAGTLVPSDAVKDPKRFVNFEWHNYMDYGDPIAYELDETAQWLQKTGFGAHFTPVTHAFSRYPFPGKAHVDYWEDPVVFGHFFDKVVKLDEHRSWRQSKNVLERVREASDDAVQAVADRYAVAVRAVTRAKGDITSAAYIPTLTFVLPYFIVLVLLFAAVYAMETATFAARGETVSLARLTYDVIGTGILMFGVTAASRLPRISDTAFSTLAGWGTLAVAMLSFGWITTAENQREMAMLTLQQTGFDLAGCAGVGLGVKLSQGCDAGISYATLAVWAVAAAVAGVSSFFARIWTRRGHLMLPALGLLTAILISASIVRAEVAIQSAMRAGELAGVTQAGGPAAASKSLWPIVIGGALFFYLWWLAYLLFDLVFVWRRYTRQAAVRTHLAEYARAVRD